MNALCVYIYKTKKANRDKHITAHIMEGINHVVPFL